MLKFHTDFLSKCNGKWEWEHSTRHSSRWLLLFTFSRWSWIWNVGFLWREENLRNLRQTLGARTRTNNKLYPHVKPGLGIELRSQWWEACILKCQLCLHQLIISFWMMQVLYKDSFSQFLDDVSIIQRQFFSVFLSFSFFRKMQTT